MQIEAVTVEPYCLEELLLFTRTSLSFLPSPKQIQCKTPSEILENLAEGSKDARIHYLTNLEGCNSNVISQVQGSFYNLYSSLATVLTQYLNKWKKYSLISLHDFSSLKSSPAALSFLADVSTEIGQYVSTTPSSSPFSSPSVVSSSSTNLLESHYSEISSFSYLQSLDVQESVCVKKLETIEKGMEVNDAYPHSNSSTSTPIHPSTDSSVEVVQDNRQVYKNGEISDYIEGESIIDNNEHLEANTSAKTTLPHLPPFDADWNAGNAHVLLGPLRLLLFIWGLHFSGRDGQFLIESGLITNLHNLLSLEVYEKACYTYITSANLLLQFKKKFSLEFIFPKSAEKWCMWSSLYVSQGLMSGSLSSRTVIFHLLQVPNSVLSEEEKVFFGLDKVYLDLCSNIGKCYLCCFFILFVLLFFIFF